MSNSDNWTSHQYHIHAVSRWIASQKGEAIKGIGNFTFGSHDLVKHIGRELTLDQESDTLLSALKQLLETSHEPDNIQMPTEYRIIDTFDDAYVIGNVAFISSNFFNEKQEFLPAVIAYLCGWINNLDSWIIILAQDSAYPYLESELLEIKEQKLNINDRPDINLLQIQTTNTRIIAHGIPDDLRPKPIGIIFGGGHKYNRFRYSYQSSKLNVGAPTGLAPSDKDWNENSTGKKGAQHYNKNFSYITDDYMQNLKAWQEVFREAQQAADLYAAHIMGQKDNLIRLLSQYRRITTISTDRDTVPFHLPIEKRLEYLRTTPPPTKEDLISKHYTKINKPTISSDEYHKMREIIWPYTEIIIRQRNTLKDSLSKLERQTSKSILEKYELDLFTIRLTQLIDDMKQLHSINPETWNTYKKIASQVENILDALYADKEVHYSFALKYFSEAIGNIDETLHELVSKLNQYDYSKLE